VRLAKKVLPDTSWKNAPETDRGSDELIIFPTLLWSPHFTELSEVAAEPRGVAIFAGAAAPTTL